tara:strand:+ start:2169 stop:2882 length:714 start_codon:yes stop_codon:yes gene_type:complete
MNLFKYFIFSVGIVSAFFAPSIKTSSGQKLSVVGQGPPFLFSTGLFGTMPSVFYSEFINYLKKNITVVSIDGFSTINENTIDEVCNALNVDKIGYIGHSSFFPEVLDNPNIEKAVLLDPINLPWLSFDGLSNSIIDLDYPVYIIKSGKLYSGSKTLPEWQDPDFKSDFETLVYDDVGHPDILDNTWANIARTIGIWEMAEGEKMNYSNWKFNIKTEVPKIRKTYRKNIAHKISEFIF